MFTNSRAALIAAAATIATVAGALVPSVSQAQYHNYCVAGGCFTHSNYKIEGLHACGPSDVMGGNPKTGSASWSEPISKEEKDAQAEQEQLYKFEGACPNPS